MLPAKLTGSTVQHIGPTVEARDKFDGVAITFRRVVDLSFAFNSEFLGVVLSAFDDICAPSTPSPLSTRAGYVSLQSNHWHRSNQLSARR